MLRLVMGMTKLTAKERMKRSTKMTVPPVTTAPTGVTQVVRHLVCPLCSLTAREGLFHGGPHESRSRIEYYGGSLPSPTGRMTDRPGIIIWDPPEPLTQSDVSLLLEKISQAEDLLKGMAPAVPKPPPLPSAPPQILPVLPPPPPIKPAKPPKRPEKKMTKTQLIKAAVEFLTGEARKHEKELERRKGSDEKKMLLLDLWDKEYKQHPESL